MINKNQIVLLVLILGLVIAKQPNQKRAAVIDVKKVNLELNKSLTFGIRYVSTSKPLMINVEFNSPSQKFNSFKISVSKGGSIIQQCHFKYINNLCVIQRPEKEVQVTITCLGEHCSSQIAFSQRTIMQPSDQSTFKGKLVVPGEIYKLSLRNFNTILQVYSERQQHEVLSEEIFVYSNVHAFSLQQTEQLDTNSAVFGLKHISKEEERYIFIENKSKKNQILKISFKTHNGELRDGITIVDFVQNYGKHSQGSYNFVGSFQKNIQANVRIFSPREPTGLPLSFFVKGKINEQAEEQIVRQLKFDSIDFGGHKFFDFMFGLTSSIHHQYKFISFHILLQQGVQDKSIFFEIGVRDTDSFQISIFDHVYFASISGQSLHFTVEPQVKLQLASGDKEIQMLTNAKQNYFSTTQNCSLQKGCNIEIKTKDQCKNCSFIFDLRDQDIQNHIIYYQVKQNTIEGKVDLEEEIFFKYSMNSKSATQIVVNTMNVVIYANFQNYNRCKLPSAACHEYAVNQQNPIVAHNKESQPTDLIIGVFGLQKTSFKVRFLNENNGLQLKLGEKFSYLMDNEQQKLELKFVIDRQSLEDNSRVHFNLISPIHSLKLTVGNLDGLNIDSLQGYVSFQKEQIHGNIFSIIIQKLPQYLKEYLHFTLLVTTTDVAVRLDTTITHYEKYFPQETKTFLVQYDAADVNALNIYTENLQKEKGSLTLTIKKPNSGSEEDSSASILHKLRRDYEFIDLDADLQQVDICDETNCELQITIKNEGTTELEQSLTLMVEQSIIALDDSIWSIFQINELSRNNHFYFIPRNKGKPINILFNTDDNLLNIDFRIFNTNNSINPQDWPFGHTSTEAEGRMSSSQEIIIPGNDSELTACWPTCVVLININEAKKIDEKKTFDHSVIKSYKILATNSILELLEDTKLQFSLQNQEEKVLFIQAKNILKYQKLTFFTYYAFGRAKITMSLISKDKQYKLNQEKDFIFEDLETILPTYVILGIINRQVLNEESVLLKITIEAETNLKMTLEYSSLLKDIYRLNMDELEVATLRKGEQTWYQFIPERDFVLKIYRIKGFPLFKVFKCSEENYTKCLSNNKDLFQASLGDFLKGEDKVKNNLEKEAREIVQNELIVNNTYPFQIFVQKSYELSDQQCQKCIFFLWIYCFQGDLELTLNIRTAMSQVELKEMKVLNERADSGQHNKYLVNVLHNKDTIITVTILQGAAQVTIADSLTTIFNNTLNSEDHNYQDFKITADDAEQPEEEEENDGQIEDVDAMGRVRKANQRHIFKHVHVTVSAILEGPVQYLISYSVGTSSLYLQDGIVVQKSMIPDIPHTFFYRNHNKKEQAYLTLSSQIEKDYEFINSKNSLNVKFYYYPDASNRNVKETFEPELPPQRNENYLGATITHIYELPSKFELYEVQISTMSYLKVTASINHQQLVYLPLEYEYLVKLHAKEMLNLVVDSPATEFLEVRIKKCDQSVPTLQYTNDAHEFKKGIFEAEVDIDSNKYHQSIKTKKNSKTLHLRLLGSENDDSLIAISVSSSSRELKRKAIQYKPGNKGVIDYRTIETDTVEVSFKPATCDKKCNSTFTYYIVVSETMQQIYGELNCAGTYFVPEASKILPPNKIDLIVVTEKNFDKAKGEYRHKVKLTGKQAYIGVKAVVQDSKEDVLYLPTEIRSFWAEMGRASWGIMVMGALAIALLLGVVALVSAKLARRGYKPISSSE